MSEQGQAPQGTVYPTPEAGPLTPPTMRDHFAEPIPGYQPAVSAQAATSTTPEAEVTGASTRTESGAQQIPVRIDVTGSGSGSAAGGAKPGQPDIDPEEIARDVVERLKPVLDAAEDVATKALDLSAKGLTSLVEKLEERRRHREAEAGSGSSDQS